MRGFKNKKWIQGDDGKCKHCGALGTKTHRLLSGSLGSEERVAFMDLVQRLQHDESSITEVQ